MNGHSGAAEMLLESAGVHMINTRDSKGRWVSTTRAHRHWHLPQTFYNDFITPDYMFMRIKS